MTTNLWPLVVGGAARFAVAWLSVTSPQQLDGGSWDALVVGSRQSRSALLERGFRRSRGIPEQPGLATAMPTMAELLLLALQPLAGHNNVMLLAVGIVSQIGVYMLLPRRAALLYWLNPILVVSAVLSPLPSLNHLILASLWTLFSVRRLFLPLLLSLLGVFAVLVLTHVPYLALLPSLLALQLSPDAYTDAPVMIYALIAFALFIFLLLEQAGVWSLGVGAACGLEWNSSSHLGWWNQAAAGVRWYVDAQVLSFFTVYYSLLSFAQPLIMAAPLYLRFPSSPLLVLHATLALVVLGHPSASFSDVSFAVATLCSHEDVVRNMKPTLPWVVLGLAIPAVLSPALLHLWIGLGTGNANFLFFQGLAMWLSLGLFIVSFLSSHAKICPSSPHD
jgi:hypothetical protein